MSHAMTERFKAIEGTPTQRFVAYMLADAHNDKTGRCDLSIASISRLTSLCERAVQKAISELECNGHVTRMYRAGTSTQYRLHPRTTCTPECDAPSSTSAPYAPPPPHVVHLTPARGAPKPERTGNRTFTQKRQKASPSEKKPRKKNTKSDPRHQPFVSVFYDAYLNAFGSKLQTSSKDYAQLHKLLKTFPDLAEEEWKAAIDWCYEVRQSDRYARGPVHNISNLAAFCANWSSLVAYHQIYKPSK